MRILAFAGSSSSVSINKKLVQFCLKNLPEAEVNFLDLNDFEMPLFSVDRERNFGYPPEINNFIEAISNVDIIICSLAEHNSNFTVVFKNLMDWTSRVKVPFFQQKPMFLMSTSTGGFAGGNVMQLALKVFPKFGASHIVHFSLPSFEENFSEEIGIIDAELRTEFTTKLKEFQLLIS